MRINKWIVLIATLYILASGLYILRSLSINAETPDWAVKYNVSTGPDISKGSNNLTESGEQADAVTAATEKAANQESVARDAANQGTANQGTANQGTAIKDTADQDAATPGNTSQSSEVQGSSAQSGGKLFTLAQLKAANGVNGAPAYIAYHGKVYDLAGESTFVNGVHNYDPRIKAGMDLSDLFDKYAPGSHQANNYIARLKEIGTLSSATGNGKNGTSSTNAGIGSTQAGTKDTVAATTPAKPAAPAESQKTFTLAQLKAANGINGAPAYIAYHGKVYDLAGDPAFINGVHKYDRNIRAGMDLTDLFDNQAPSSHQANNYISRLSLVGVMDAAYTTPAASSAGSVSSQESEYEEGEED